MYIGSHIDSTQYYGLNMKSLCQPAVLPLSTNFLASPRSLKDDYFHQGMNTIIDDKQVIDCLNQLPFDLQI